MGYMSDDWPSAPPMNALVNKVHCCDALELLTSLADNSVDIVVTSPPYNLQRKNRRGGGLMKNSNWTFQFEGGYDEHDDEMPENEYQAWIHDIVKECLRISKGIVWVNHKTRYRDGIGIHPLQFMPFPLWSEVIWNRSSGIMMNARRFAPSHEYVFGFGRPHYWDDKLNTRFTVWNIPPETGDIDHECPYPEQLIAPLIQASCPAGGIVLDPFMGSGTSGATARKLGRQFIGSDTSQRHVTNAMQRIFKTNILPIDDLPLFAKAVGE